MLADDNGFCVEIPHSGCRDTWLSVRLLTPHFIWKKDKKSAQTIHLYNTGRKILSKLGKQWKIHLTFFLSTNSYSH